MRTACFRLLFVIVPVVLLILPPEVHYDPRAYLPVYAACAAGLVWLALAVRKHRRELLARLDEMERQYGPGVYQNALDAYREGRRRKRDGN